MKKGWEIKESEVTPEAVFMNRRAFLAQAGIVAGAAALGAGTLGAAPAHVAAATTTDYGNDIAKELYPPKVNLTYQGGRSLSLESITSKYNNFYEFGSHKRIAKAAQALKLSPWDIEIEGEVARPQKIAVESLIRKMKIEERIYRHRCVEAWSMIVPWSGFELRKLVKLAEPTSNARYVEFTTFFDKEVASGQKQVWYPWPYTEAITIEEAMNELAFMVTGIYGHPLQKQFGAPLRLALPWKYGFKSIKSIVKIRFTKERPVSFWEKINSREYGFWANVNPQVPHPRWSQASEEPLGEGRRVPTRLFNGYEKFVAHLYKGLESEPLYR